MRHPIELILHRFDDVGVAIAMANRPPGGDAINQRAAVSEVQTHTLGGCDRQRRRCGLHLGIGTPEVQAGRIRT